MRIRSKLLLLIYGIVILSLICVIVFAILFSGLSHGKYVYDEETGIGAPWNMHGMLRTVFEEDRSTNRQLDSDVAADYFLLYRPRFGIYSLSI